MQIDIITHEDRPLRDFYLIAKLAWHWERAGIRIQTGTHSQLAPEADLGICHFDLTRVQPAWIPQAPEGRPLLNAQVLDISKSRISTQRVQPNDAWQGPVILKSDTNAFGKPEWQAGPRHFWSKRRRKLARQYWRYMRRLPPDDYPVLDHVSKVPAWVWRAPNIVVERFLPERDGPHYCLRSWIFFGKRGYGFRLISENPVVKTSNIVSHDFLQEAPTEVLACIEQETMDFGKIDYVEVDGRSIILDINKTPSMATDADTERLANLASGLDDYIASPSDAL